MGELLGVVPGGKDRVLPNSHRRVTPVTRGRRRVLVAEWWPATVYNDNNDTYRPDDTEAGLRPDGETEIESDTGFIVVMQVGSQTFGVVVDGVFHTEEIVVKPMSTMLRNLTMFSGNTILGDGAVIMIIDPNGVASAMASHASSVVAEGERKEAEEAMASAMDGQSSVSMLLFRAGSPEPKAVPLSLVTRLEEFEVSKIERSNGRDLVQYRGALMPLVYIDPTQAHRGDGTQPMLVFSDAGRSMGLVVDEIVDIVEDRMNIEVGSDRAGVLGSAVIKDKATEIIDLGYYLPQAFEDWFMRKEMDIAALTKKVLLVDVSDIEMPEINGFEFCEALRRDPRFRKMPILALSAVVSPASIERGRQAGFDDYVAKFDRPGLIASLKDLFAGEMGIAA